MADSNAQILRPLVERISELAARPSEAVKKESGRATRRLCPQKIPVTVTYEGIPDKQWESILAPDCLKCEEPFARGIEYQLKRRIWAAEHIGDDHVAWPMVFVPAALNRPHDWGVPLAWQGTGDELGARRIVAPFQDGIDLGRVRFTDQEIDEAGTARRVEMGMELVGGALAVHVAYPTLGFSPVETAIEMRGMEGFMFDAADSPEKLEALMEVITGAYAAHHRRRESKGWLNVYPADGGKYIVSTIFRIHCRYGPGDAAVGAYSLADEWAYVSAQSAAGLGPAMFDRFVHRFNRRLAEYFVNDTVYFHGCEKLDHKLDVIATLPHLRRFHVSPWSSVAAARDKFAGRVVLEVHAHPGKVFFTSTPEDMRAEIRALVEAAEGVPIDLNLSDINTVNGRPETLSLWASIAREESLRR